MQILGTEVRHATSASGEPIVRLVFLGEGGESIAVDMASDGGDNHPEEVLERARVMLVQTAAFGMRDVSARQFGTHRSDTTETIQESPNEGETFVFEYREGDGSRHASAILPDAVAVRAEAMRSAIDLIDETAQYNQSGWLIRVYDESGALVCSIDAGEAIAEHKKARTAYDI